MGRRRFAWIQGGPVAPAFRLLFEGPGGYYVGGDSETPALIAPYSSAAFPNGIFLTGITTLEGGTWFVSGEARDADFGQRYFVFYGLNGLLFSMAFPAASIGSGSFLNGHFNAAIQQNASIGLDRAVWAKPSGEIGVGERGGASVQYQLPNVLSTGTRTQVNLDYSYALSLDAARANTTAFPSRTDYLVSAAGTFLQLDQPLFAGNRRAGDLLGLTYYSQGTELNSTRNFVLGENTVAITPSTIALDGVVTPGTAFNVSFVGPDPAQYRALNASYWTP